MGNSNAQVKKSFMVNSDGVIGYEQNLKSGIFVAHQWNY
jgi:hypothetical protein